MAPELSKCKITVLKATINQDLVDEYLIVTEEYGPCELFRPGQEFIVDEAFGMPEGFCQWAWADIRREILAIATGSDPPWIKQRGSNIVGCTDWFRPVYFKLERVD
jgi:uncharacterized repeat protein (TIGR04076 family)